MSTESFIVTVVFHSPVGHWKYDYNTRYFESRETAEKEYANMKLQVYFSGLVQGEIIRSCGDFAGIPSDIRQRKSYDEFYVNIEGVYEISLKQILILSEYFDVIIRGNMLTWEEV